MSQKFCTYVFVSGERKGQNCKRFCRSGRDLCYSHYAQMNKYNKKKSSLDDSIKEDIDVQHKEDIDVQPKVHLLNLNEKYVYESSSSSISSTSSD